jgi:hypothetical protein
VPLAAPASLRACARAGPLVVVAAIPFLFLHRHYSPSVSLGRVDVFLSDLAVLAVVVSALACAPSHVRRLRETRAVWIAWIALAVLIVMSTAWGALRFDAYPAATHAVTAAKWLEYMLLAPAIVLVADDVRSLRLWAGALIAWSCVETTVGVLQFAGAIGNFEHTPAGSRKPSLSGDHDFATLSAAALALGLLLLARRPGSTDERRAAWVAGGAGAVGMVVSGAFDAFVGELLAVTLILIAVRPDRRRVAAILGVLAAIAVGLFTVRSRAVADGLKFLGLKHGTGGASQNVQSYRQRTLLAYIGGRIFLAHPFLGVGWQGSNDEFAYGPFLADAHRRFVQPTEAFPSPAHPWGVQNAYVESLADLGAAGLIVFIGALAVPAGVALRRGRGDPRIAGPALILVASGAWNGYGLIAGVPIDAFTWLAVGVAAASVAVREVAPTPLCRVASVSEAGPPKVTPA